MTKIEKSKQGKKNRKTGREFEKVVQKDLESKGWIVARWTKNVEFEKLFGMDIKVDEKLEKEKIKIGYGGSGKILGKLIDSKPKFNPFTKSLMMNSSGFPDFICFRKRNILLEVSKENFSREDEISRINIMLRELINDEKIYEVIGVECKTNGRSDKIEKEKCKWLLDNHIFSKILIASKVGKEINYKGF